MRRLLSTIGPDATAPLPRVNPHRLLTIGPDATAPLPRVNPGRSDIPEWWVANPSRRATTSLEGWVA